MLNDGVTSTVEPAALEGKKVVAEVMDQFKGQKVIIFKFKKRKRYHRTKGHRQNLTKLKIVELPVEEAATSASSEDAE
jgi:large subunit ribosomal protein L21